jgi:hypothetical protein
MIVASRLLNLCFCSAEQKPNVRGVCGVLLDCLLEWLRRGMLTFHVVKILWSRSCRCFGVIQQ